MRKLAARFTQSGAGRVEAVDARSIKSVPPSVIDGTGASTCVGAFKKGRESVVVAEAAFWLKCRSIRNGVVS
jgi:hypothetical protein